MKINADNTVVDLRYKKFKLASVHSILSECKKKEEAHWKCTERRKEKEQSEVIKNKIEDDVNAELCAS